MKVSVVMPVYNVSQYLREAIESILKQTFSDFELIVIDDGSQDNSIDIIETYQDSRIRLYKNTGNRGVAYTRNRAIELSKGEFIAIMDSDDIAPSYRLQKEVEYLDENPNVACVGGNINCINQKGEKLNRNMEVFFNPNYLKAYMLFNNGIANGSAMFRREIVNKFKIRYLDNYCGIEDYRFWCELLLHGKIININEVLLYYRIVETGLTNSNNKESRSLVLDEIHGFNLEKNGFSLTENDKNAILQAFREEAILESVEEIENLFHALQTLKNQAISKNMSNASEIVDMCRKRFGEKVGKAMFLWK